MDVRAQTLVAGLRLADCPPGVVRRAQDALLDLVAVAAAGTSTECSRLVRDHAAAHLAPGAGRRDARIVFDGRRASPVGAALAAGATIDSLDGHDGHSIAKGHAGAAVLAALLACADAEGPLSGADFLASLVVGYEVATRAGLALHSTAADYHSSGAWNAVGAAAVAARLLGLDAGPTRHALGIAEYHGPRSPMLRCIAHPTMVKDGSGWGAMTGVSAAYLAATGFTGAPAETVERPDVAEVWADLGARWRILEHYVKPYPVCRWAHPAVDAALAVSRRHGLDAADIERVEVTSFDPAVRLAVAQPETTEEAQYSLPFAVAAALVRGRIDPADVDGAALSDPELRRIGAAITLTEDESHTARFPAERWAQVVVVLRNGSRLESGPHVTDGVSEQPRPAVLAGKLRSYAEPVLGEERTKRIADRVADLRGAQSAGGLLDDLLEAP